jgi:hypothetical protein
MKKDIGTIIWFALVVLCLVLRNCTKRDDPFKAVKDRIERIKTGRQPTR